MMQALLSTETAAFLIAFAQMFSSIEHLSIPEQRAAIKQMFQVPEDQLEPVAKVENKIISGRNGPIPLKIYTPEKEGPLPIIVFLHRGGWVYGNLDEAEVICRRLTNEMGVIVASVEYRLSPENKFPIPLEDCYDATEWVVNNASSLSGNPSKIIIAGESAGGNLATAVSLMSRDKNAFKLAGQILMYPVLTTDLNPVSYENSPDKYLLSFENMQFFINSYLKTPADGENPYASPLKSTNLSGLPPCFIITAEHDALKVEGKAYAEALQNAGVKTEIKCYKDVVHGFLDLPLAEETKAEARADIKTWLNSL